MSEKKDKNKIRVKKEKVDSDEETKKENQLDDYFLNSDDEDEMSRKKVKREIEESEDIEDFGQSQHTFEDIEDMEETMEEKNEFMTKKLEKNIKFSDLSDKRKEAAHPYVLNFPNAPPPPISLQNYFNDNPPSTILKVNVYHKQEPRKLHQRIVTGETDRLEYISDNFLAPHNINKYIIGVYNKREKTMKLVETPHIFVMQQRIKTLEDNVESTSRDASSTRKLQIETFGGKKSKQQLTSNVENRVSEANTSENFSSSISNSIMIKLSTDADLIAETQPVRDDLPPFDMQATDPKNIYKLSDIITEEMEDAIAPNVMSLSTLTAQAIATYIENNSFPVTMQTHLGELASKVGLQKKKFAIHIMFLTYLIRFYKQYRQTGETHLANLSRRIEIPLTVLSLLIPMFTARTILGDDGESRFVMNSALKNKLTNYIIIVHLILSGFSININTLMEDLGLEKRKIGTFLLSLGCKLTSSTSRRFAKKDQPNDGEQRVIATLSAPLTFPDPGEKKFRRN